MSTHQQHARLRSWAKHGLNQLHMQASEELDITEKEGEFLTKESAEEKMAAALSGEASIRRVSPPLCPLCTPPFPQALAAQAIHMDLLFGLRVERLHCT